MKRKSRPIRTTVVGGILFLVPFGVLLVVLEKLFDVMHRLAQPMSNWIPVDTVAGVAVANLVTISLLVLVCWFAGFLATRGRLSGVQRSLDEKLLLIFPRYTFLKAILEGFDTAGVARTLKPVIVQFDDLAQICFEVERDAGQVTVFLPGSPDPWSGSVALVGVERVQSIEAPIPAVVRTLRSAGVGTAALMTH
jgi:uncharacterized membrane protein